MSSALASGVLGFEIPAPPDGWHARVPCPRASYQAPCHASAIVAAGSARRNLVSNRDNEDGQAQAVMRAHGSGDSVNLRGVVRNLVSATGGVSAGVGLPGHRPTTRCTRPARPRGGVWVKSGLGCWPLGRPAGERER